MSKWNVPFRLSGAILLGVVFGTLGLTVLHHGSASPVHAQSAGECSNATLNGTYGGFGQGYVYVGSDGTPLSAPLWRTLAVVLTADGAGNITRSGTTNSGGTIGPAPGTGTYTVNADCTFQITYGPAAHVAGVLMEGGASAFWITSDPVLSSVGGTFERQ